MREKTSLVSLNRGLVSRLGLARIDLKRLALGAEVMQNWMPRVLGAMSLRPGLKYLLNTLGNQQTRYLKFIFATSDTALLEFTPLFMRVVVNDVLLTRPVVTSVVTNGAFSTDLTGWTDNDEAGAASTWASPGYLQLVGTGTLRAIRDQQVTCSTPNVEHAFRVVIARGPVTIRVGNASGDDTYVRETTLYAGTHSLAFTPSGNFWIRFASAQIPKVWVQNCTVESSGVVTLPTPWGASDLQNIRIDQSADVIFAACAGFQQRRIERRGTHPNGRSWSVALYQSNNGPFQIQNITPLTLAPSGINGNITLTASAALFRSTHVGALFSLTSIGQVTTATAGAANVPTPSIRVVGAGASRAFSWEITGFGSATVDLQRSYDNTTWVNVGGGFSWTADVSDSLDDALTNQIVFYRLNCSVWASGSIVMTLRFSGGSIRGVVRVTDFSTSVSVGAEVLVALGGTTASSTWQEGQWSDKRGWPTAGKFHEGRLWWTGQNGIWGSVSDAYDSFDETFLGDAGPINRTIGSGPVDTINWLLSMRGLLMGAQGTEITARSSSLDEPLTPTNFNVKTPSTQGSGPVEALKVDQMGYFINRSNTKLYELAFNVRAYDYDSTDLMEIVPELGVPGIVRMDSQRQPDTRIHCVRADGTGLVAVMNKGEEVLAWVTVLTDGIVEDVVTLPAISGNLDDQVYYVVKRTVNGSTVRFLEKWAQEIDCRGDKAYCDLADAHVRYQGAPTTTVSAPHLEGKPVTVWADGLDVGTNDSVRPWTQTYTINSGVLSPPLLTPASSIVVGLPYVAPFKSVKLGQMTQEGTPLNQQKKVMKIGLVCADLHPKGLKFGDTLDDTGSHRMDDMPSMEDGAPVTGMRTAYDQNLIPFPGSWTTDARICMQAQAPRPATVLAITSDLAAN